VDILGITANSFARSICRLLEDAHSFPAAPPNEVQTSVRENACATSTIVLTIAMLESAIGHAEWEEDYVSSAHNKRSVWERLDLLVPRNNYGELRDDLEELFVQRDVLMHGHLWKASIEEDVDASTLRFVTPPVRVAGYGDGKFAKVFDPDTLRSRRLDLNLFPIRIWRRDTWVVLATALDVIEVAGSSLRLRFGFRIGGKRIHFADLRERARAIADAMPVS